jgi:hypothetical protein
VLLSTPSADHSGRGGGGGGGDKDGGFEEEDEEEAAPIEIAPPPPLPPPPIIHVFNSNATASVVGVSKNPPGMMMMPK